MQWGQGLQLIEDFDAANRAGCLALFLTTKEGCPSVCGTHGNRLLQASIAKTE